MNEDDQVREFMDQYHVSEQEARFLLGFGETLGDLSEIDLDTGEVREHDYHSMFEDGDE